MKKLFILLLIACSFGASAQTKAQETAHIKLPTIQCDMCKNRIETYVKRYDGISSIVVNVKNKEAVVKYLTDRINIEDIKAAIATAGFDADDVTAEPDAYKRLPTCCKKPEDGGGMKKN